MRALEVPFLSPRDVERAADELLHQYAVARDRPLGGAVDIDFVVEKVLKLDLSVTDLKGSLGVPSVLGATSVPRRTILVDESLEPMHGRFAFTMAHEVGHWQLHRQFIDESGLQTTLFDHEPPTRGPEGPRARREKPRVELQADLFGACLLMPARLVRAAVDMAFDGRLPSWEGIEARLAAGQPDERFVEVANAVLKAGAFHNVSNMAMRVRLRDLKLVVDASNPQRSLL
jgi:Zn-dependent peptidase ImmA (M78 family)